MSKYMFSLIAIMVLSLLSFLAYKNYDLSNDLTKAKESLANANTLLDIQNKAIKQQKLDLNAYKENRELENNRLNSGYAEIKIESNKCQAQLRAINKALDKFYIEHNKAGF